MPVPAVSVVLRGFLARRAPAQVRRDGQVQAQGSPAGCVTLGPLEDWLESQAAPGVIDGIRSGRARYETLTSAIGK